MDYRVKLMPRIHVLDATGQLVPDAHVIEIAFPGASIQTPRGRIERITGQGSARITVDDILSEGVPLC
ncbi:MULTISPECIES: hypothetical protein [Sphingomonadales]|jgi:hypothetical protein|uniref:Uncharacterized protein n=1 Tax=Novosphingobium panipatense TaxID=428991 RepID=A0ABY1QTH3_9SPHN|nr:MULTISPECIES: hypothetical protein [Sphingomonadaceae]SMP79701.1 hypothetical protein SAMN06296065_113100 [Novosphingobium panipatense]